MTCIFQPFQAKIASETDADKKAMYERSMTKIQEAIVFASDAKVAGDAAHPEDTKLKVTLVPCVGHIAFFFIARRTVQ